MDLNRKRQQLGQISTANKTEGIVRKKCQSLVEDLLRDEDNKYCVECDAKGPRWASWNIGVFLCIRCAGIHRNLGVHISKVKSVNLDAWTPQHVAYVQRMGNRRAREIYEANLPDDFRRPQTDTALESFIRAKYEHKRYISSDYVDPGPPPPAFDVDTELKQKRSSKPSALASDTCLISITTTEPSTTPAVLPKPPLPPPPSSLLADVTIDEPKPSANISAVPNMFNTDKLSNDLDLMNSPSLPPPATSVKPLINLLD